MKLESKRWGRGRKKRERDINRASKGARLKGFPLSKPFYMILTLFFKEFFAVYKILVMAGNWWKNFWGIVRGTLGILLVFVGIFC